MQLHITTLQRHLIVCVCVCVCVSRHQKTSEKHKIIVYTTSFRGVRSTFEDCKYVLLVLHNLRMEVDERDTYTNPSYITEMEKKVGCTQCKLPQVFIGGRHIGVRAKKLNELCVHLFLRHLKSNTEVEELNESGELRVLLADFPVSPENSSLN